MLSGGTVHNEIFVKVAEGADISKVRERIAAIPEYSALTVAECLDLGYISTRARNLSAPVTIAGAAVALLCIAGVALVFTSGVRERRAYAAKLALVGGTKKRIFAMFALESALLAAAGAVIGSLVAVGIFALMLYIVLSSAMSFSVNAALLFAAAVTGALTAFAASLYPLVRVFSSTARENLVGAPEKGRAGLFATAALVLATLVSLCVENLLPGAKGALSAVNMVLVIACAAMAAPFIVKGFGRLAISSRSPSVIVAGVSALRERRATRASSILAVGMTMSMLLFTAWSLTTSVFSDFTSEFEDMILVTNLSSDVDVSELEEVEGVRGAHLMVWRQAVISADGMEEKTVNILGSATALELVEFEYATSREEVVAALAEGKVILDGSVRELYGVDKGDFVLLDVDGETRRFEVGGIVRHNLFNVGHPRVGECIRPDRRACVHADGARLRSRDSQRRSGQGIFRKDAEHPALRRAFTQRPAGVRDPRTRVFGNERIPARPPRERARDDVSHQRVEDVRRPPLRRDLCFQRHTSRCPSSRGSNEDTG